MAGSETTAAGWLAVVGTGYQLGGDVSAAAEGWIRAADRVFFLMGDGASAAWLRGLNSAAETLRLSGGEGVAPRHDKYAAMVARVLAPLREGRNVCLALYGHPGVLSGPAHAALARARADGHETRLLPGISAEGRLFADLGIDPGATGWACFDATDFVLHRRTLDPSVALVLFQPAMVGTTRYRDYAAHGLPALKARLAESYGADHGVVIYEASPFAICPPRMDRCALADLSPEHLAPESLLYVPPLGPPPPDPVAMARLVRADLDAAPAAAPTVTPTATTEAPARHAPDPDREEA